MRCKIIFEEIKIAKLILGFFLPCVTSFTAHAYKVTTSGQLNAAQIVTNATLGIYDPDWMPAPSSIVDCGRAEAYVKVSVDMLYPQKVTQGSVTIRLNIKGYEKFSNSSFIDRNIDFVINPDNSITGERNIFKKYRIANAYRLNIKVISIKNSSGVSIACPQNININTEIESYKINNSINLTGLSLRHVLLDLDNTPQVISSTNGDATYAQADEMQISWNAVAGAEYYELEWAYVNDYKEVAGTYLNAGEIDFDENSFRHNSTRISTTSLSYSIPLLYDRGFLVYRLRIYYLTDCGSNELTASPWSNAVCNSTLDCFSPNYQKLYGHENSKNWQQSMMFAEGAKEKDIISYFDGTKRNRQSVVRNNTDDLAIVSENIYDYQGRPALKVLPAPAGEAVKYYDDFNRQPDGSPYSKDNFDIDATSCDLQLDIMAPTSGASNYFSTSNPDRSGINAYLPRAHGYPFAQTEYEPDNTGRVKRQGGVGSDYQLGSGHEIKYFYSTPDQEELDKLFGTDVGYAKYYKKIVTIDPNGQITITYKDFAGRVIAAGLTGENPANLDALKDGEGNDLYTIPNSSSATDMLDKVSQTDQNTDQDRNFVNADGDGLDMNYTFTYAKKDDFDGAYSFILNPFTDNCFSGTTAYEPVVDLHITVFDPQCQAYLLDHTTQMGSYNTNNSPLVVLSYTIPTIADLEKGSYSVSKSWKINEKALNDYADQYIQDAVCLTPYSDFLSAEIAKLDFTDCDDMLNPDANDSQDCIDALDPNDPNYTELLKECQEAFTAISPCDEMYKAMLADVSPGGQYGSYEVDENGNFYSIDPLSVFNDGSDPDHPNLLPAGAPVSYPGGSVQATIQNWDPLYAYNLVEHHPEYNYYNNYYQYYCDSYQDHGITTQEYDWLLQKITTVDDIAEINTYVNIDAGNPIDLTYTPGSGSFPILDEDPYFTNSANTNATYQKAAMVNLLSNYKGSGKDIYEYAACAARCGNWFGKDKDTKPCPGVNDNYGSSMDAIIMDKEWNLMKSAYLEVKYQYLYYLANEAALDILNASPTTYDCNVSIGAKDFNPFYYLENRYTLLFDPNYSSIYSFSYLFNTVSKLSVSGWTSFLYKNKVRRFRYFDPYLPTNSDSDQDQEDADKEIYERTGLCPLANDLKNLIEDVGSNFDMTNDVPLREVSGFSPDLYLRVTGLSAINNTNYADYHWTPSIYNSGLQLKVNLVLDPSSGYSSSTYNRTNFIELNFQSGSAFSWNGYGTAYEIVRVRKVVPNPGLNSGSRYGFSIEVEIEDNSGDQHSEVLTGSVDGINLSDCSGTFGNGSPQPTQTSSYLVTLFNLLIKQGSFTSAGVDLDIAPYKNAFETSLKPLIDVLNPGNTSDYNWNQGTSNTEYEVSAAGANVKYRIFFCSTPSYSFGASNYYFRNLRPIDPANPPGCTANGMTPNFQVEAVQVTFSSSVPPTEIVTTLYGYADLYDPHGGSAGTGEIVSEVNTGFIGSSWQSGPVQSCPELADGRMALQNFLNTCLPLDYQQGVHNVGAPSNILPEILYQQLGPVDYFDPQYAGGGVTYYAAFQVPQDPQSYVGTFFYGHGNSASPESVYFDSEAGNYAVDIGPEGTNAWGIYHCTLNMHFVDNNLDLNFSDVVGITKLEGKPGTFSDGVTNQFIAMAIMGDGNLYEIEGQSCFQFAECTDCIQTAPAIPTNCWADYQNFMDNVVSVLNMEDYMNLTQEDYCNMGITCLDKYIEYLQAMNVNSENSPYYIAVGDFCNGDMGYYLDYYKIYMATVLGSGDPNNFASLLPDPYNNEFVLLRDFALSGVGNDCVDQYNNYFPTQGNNAIDIITFCSGVGYEYPCPKISFEPFPAITIEGNPCDDNYNNIARVNADQAYEKYIEEVKEDFKERYTAYILENSVETFYRYNDPVADYQYTLYYYDQAGNLVKTVPPKAVQMLSGTDLTTVKGLRSSGTSTLIPPHNDALSTRYYYNSLNQLVSQVTPDGGTSNFWYDKVGRLVLSQNAKQFGNDEFSYTKYDDLGRVIEVGELTATGITIGKAIINDETFPANINTVRNQVTKTFYDAIELTAGLNYYQAFDPDFTFENLRNRVSATAYYENWDDATSVNDDFDFATEYSYDVHGNVKNLVQDFKKYFTQGFRRYKKVEYEYDLISGNVNKVIYEPGEMDQFIHKYDYDADNRISNVQTSRDGDIWSNDASYNYYKHGPLARTVLGDAKVQGIDDAYTLEGWLKAINSGTLDPARDMGGDGLNDVALDVLAYGINYNSNDYGPIGTSAGNIMPSTTGMGLTDLYNGNISGVVSSFNDNVEDPVKTQGYRYTYDQLNRLVNMDVFKDPSTVGDNVLANNSFSGISQSQDYHVNIHYDPNGNIETLYRNGYSASGQLGMDDLSYTYKNNTNQLLRVDDNGPASNVYDDVEDQTQINNYSYDAIGNLTADAQEEIQTINWTVSGKIKDIIRSAGSSAPDLSFEYDAAGNRVVKIEKPAGGTQNDWKYTFYVRDASGNIMALYSRTGSQNLRIKEFNMYGSDRIGTVDVDEEVYNNKLGGCTGLSVNLTLDNTYEVINNCGSNVPQINFTSSSAAFLFSAIDEDITLAPALGGTVNGGSSVTVDKGHTLWVTATSNVTVNSLTGRFKVVPLSTAMSLSLWGVYVESTPDNEFAAGKKQYELKNHLGNVMSTVADYRYWKTYSHTTDIFRNTFDDPAELNDWQTVDPVDLSMNDGVLTLTPMDKGTGITRKVTLPEGCSYELCFEISDIRPEIQLLVDYNGENIIQDILKEPGRICYQIEADGGKDLVIQILGDPETLIALSEISLTATCNTDYLVADVLNSQDYYPFGSIMPGRNYQGSENYRYGFNGMEMDNEVSGNGNQYDYGFRIYNPRLGRFLSVDPLTSDYPAYTPYQFAGNTPIAAIDLDGLEELIVTDQFAKDAAVPMVVIEKSKHLKTILSSVTRLDRYAKIKVYLSSNRSKKIAGSYTVNLGEVAKRIQAYQKLNPYEKQSKGKTGKEQFEQDLETFKSNGIEVDEVLERVDNGEEVWLISVDQEKVNRGVEETTETIIHEMDAHLRQNLDRADAPTVEDAKEEHKRYFNQSENPDSYSNVEYGDGYYSPSYDDIPENSPAGKNKDEIKKSYSNVKKGD